MKSRCGYHMILGGGESLSGELHGLDRGTIPPGHGNGKIS